jgi:predicted metal-dependent phosphoesterase TrpH
MCTVPVLKRFCRESYNNPLDVYLALKRRGMDVVTVTDHDSIGASEELRRFPDFFVSEEVTCVLPSGAEAHVAVYGIDERQHREIRRRRNDIPSLLPYLREQNILFGINHAFSALTGRRHREDFALFENEFPVFEGRNGQIPASANQAALSIAARMGKACTAGSDAHTMASLGRTWTEVPGARNAAEFLDGLRTGRALLAGEHGTAWKLSRALLEIGGHFVGELGWPVALAPLFVAAPFSAVFCHAQDSLFAANWLRRLEQGSPAMTPADAPVAA